MFAGAGYLVLYANYRGSTSYGWRFADIAYRDFPGPAYDDLMSVVDAAVAAGVADPSRLYVTGGSAGGQAYATTVKGPAATPCRRTASPRRAARPCRRPASEPPPPGP